MSGNIMCIFKYPHSINKRLKYGLFKTPHFSCVVTEICYMCIAASSPSIIDFDQTKNDGKKSFLFQKVLK